MIASKPCCNAGHNAKKQRLSEVVDCVRPGDLIGFSSLNPLSAAIALGTYGIPGWDLTHVGIVAREESELLLAESTMQLSIPCRWSRQLVAGVQAHGFRQRMEHHLRGFGSRLWWYRCKTSLDASQEADLSRKCRLRRGVAYDMLGAFRARSTPLGWLLRWIRKRPADLRTLFCSEFAAHIWQEMGLMSFKYNPSDIHPRALGRIAVNDHITHEPVELVL